MSSFQINDKVILDGRHYVGGVGYIISWVSEPNEPLMPYISFIRDEEMNPKYQQQNGTYYTQSLIPVTQDPKTCAHCHIGFSRCLHCGQVATAQIFKEQVERNPNGL